MNILKIVQDYEARWHIENTKGNIILDSITIGNAVEAEKFLKNYVSSYFPWADWTCIVVPLKKGPKNV